MSTSIAFLFQIAHWSSCQEDRNLFVFYSLLLLFASVIWILLGKPESRIFFFSLFFSFFYVTSESFTEGLLCVFFDGHAIRVKMFFSMTQETERQKKENWSRTGVLNGLQRSYISSVTFFASSIHLYFLIINIISVILTRYEIKSRQTILPSHFLIHLHIHSSIKQNRIT